MTKPKDPKLYASIKKRVYQQIPKHSAYRSGHLVREYKKAFHKKHGTRKEPYTGGSKPLKRWFDEEWKTQDGSKVYKKKSDIFRPTKKINEKTPTTHKELSKGEITAARKEKSTRGRVKNFRFPKGMKEKIIDFKKGSRGKKYEALIIDSRGNQRSIAFGASKFEHFKDTTGKGFWSKKNHGSVSRRKAYFNRHSGVDTKKEALQKEIQASGGRFNAKILSHKFLW